MDSGQSGSHYQRLAVGRWSLQSRALHDPGPLTAVHPVDSSRSVCFGLVLHLFCPILEVPFLNLIFEGKLEGNVLPLVLGDQTAQTAQQARIEGTALGPLQQAAGDRKTATQSVPPGQSNARVRRSC